MEHGSPTERPDSPSVLANPRSERVRAIRRLSGRSARLRAGRFVAEGPQAVRAAVTTPHVVAAYATYAATQRHPDVVRAAREAGRPVQQVTDEVIAALADTVTPQGILAVCSLLDVSIDDVVASGPRLVAVLAHVRDPGNAGSVLRAADAAGADAVVFTQASVDVYNPKCVRSTAGSMFHLPVVVGVTLGDVVSALRGCGLRVLAADGAGEHALDEVQAGGGLAGPTAWVFGNEAWGLAKADAALADDVVRVPVFGRAESLNLAAAATVCLYASAFAQRGLVPARASALASASAPEVGRS